MQIILKSMLRNLSIIDLFLILTVIASVLIFLYVFIISLIENEKRAAYRGLAFVPVFLLLFLFPLLLEEGETIGLILLIFSYSFLFLLVFPTRVFEQNIDVDSPVGQINEKNVMFSRNLYEKGSDRYTEYYRDFPEHEIPDNKFREKPGLMSTESVFYDPVSFEASRTIFEAIHSFYPHVDGDARKEKTDMSPEEIFSFMSTWMKKRGAISVGATKMEDYHWYSSVGRGEHYGEPAALPHSHGIAFTVEMDKEMMDTAPQGPTVLESARQYMNAAVIATEMAMFLRGLGFNARAHIDGNYRLVCPLVARDAGLGEIGRMGLLMTPELGPRVRLGVITTDCEVPVSKPKDFSHMISFCRICKKCADVCPSGAISFDDRSVINGVKRWQINQESCYTYWCITGTDCGKCISDCPYSHPDNFFHNVIRRLLKNSVIFRHFAIKMDDFFYGRKPKMKAVPDWLKANHSD